MRETLRVLQAGEKIILTVLARLNASEYWLKQNILFDTKNMLLMLEMITSTFFFQIILTFGLYKKDLSEMFGSHESERVLRSQHSNLSDTNYLLLFNVSRNISSEVRWIRGRQCVRPALPWPPRHEQGIWTLFHISKLLLQSEQLIY